MFGGILFGGFGILLMLLLAPIALCVFAFWIWMPIHASTNRGLTDTEKLMWVLIIVFVHFIGALIYFFVGRPKGKLASA